MYAESLVGCSGSYFYTSYFGGGGTGALTVRSTTRCCYERILATVRSVQLRRSYRRLPSPRKLVKLRESSLLLSSDTFGAALNLCI